MPHDHADHDVAHAGAHLHAGHNHVPANFGNAFLIGIILNTLFIAAEVVYGLRSHSLALLADAGHNASDVLGLFLAWGATWLARCKPTARYTYGLQGSSILAAIANAIFLLMVTGGIAWEAFQRFAQPSDVGGTTVTVVAGVGIFINGITALLFMKGSKTDLNIRGAYLHMMADAAVSLGVVISGLAIMQTGWLWLDPVVSLAIAIIIVISTWGLLRDAIKLAVHAVPAHIDPAKVKGFLENMEGVLEAHDLHIWAMSTSDAALSAHLVMKNGHPGDAFIREVTHALKHQFNIGHSTLQIELGDGDGECALAPATII